MPMLVASLASGSSGNSYYVQSPEGAVLIDAGLTGRKVAENIIAAGGDPALVRGVIVTHDHSDHAAGAGVLQRKYGWRLWMTRGTYAAAGKRLGRVDVDLIRAGSGLKAAGLEFRFVGTPHDGEEPVVVSVERGGRRCGIFTDLGHVFSGLADEVEAPDFAFIESNYDPDLLARNRRYPPPLKARIRGRHGHLSNGEAAGLIAGLRGDRLKSVVLAHLSEENNRPDVARACFTGALNGRIQELGMRVGVAPRHEAMRLCAVL